MDNPKQISGSAKVSFAYIPPIALVAEGIVMAQGAGKYGAYSWGHTAVRASTYYNAAMRHLLAWYTGEDLDPESGQSHMAHVRACAGIVLDAAANNKLVDDRPCGLTTAVGTETLQLRRDDHQNDK